MATSLIRTVPTGLLNVIQVDSLWLASQSKPWYPWRLEWLAVGYAHLSSHSLLSSVTADMIRLGWDSARPANRSRLSLRIAAEPPGGMAHHMLHSMISLL